MSFSYLVILYYNTYKKKHSNSPIIKVMIIIYDLIRFHQKSKLFK